MASCRPLPCGTCSLQQILFVGVGDGHPSHVVLDGDCHCQCVHSRARIGAPRVCHRLLQAASTLPYIPIPRCLSMPGPVIWYPALCGIGTPLLTPGAQSYTTGDVPARRAPGGRRCHHGTGEPRCRGWGGRPAGSAQATLSAAKPEQAARRAPGGMDSMPVSIARSTNRLGLGAVLFT